MAEALRAAPVAARYAVPLAVVAVQLTWGAETAWQETVQGSYQRQVLATVTAALQKNVAPGSVVITDRQLLQDLDFVRIWKTADESNTGLGGGGRGMMMMGPGAQDGNTPNPRQAGETEFVQSKYPGTTHDREKKFSADVVKWAGGEKVYFVGTEDQVEQLMAAVSDYAYTKDTHIRAHVVQPPPPPMPTREGIMGMPGGAMRFRVGGGAGAGAGPFGMLNVLGGGGGGNGRTRNGNRNRNNAPLDSTQPPPDILIVEWAVPNL